MIAISYVTNEDASGFTNTQQLCWTQNEKFMIQILKNINGCILVR